MNRMIKTAGVMLTAFFELCLTGRAVCAWRIAQSDGSFSAKPAGDGSRPGHYCILYNRASGICPNKPPKLALFVIAVFFVSAVMFAGYKIVRSRSVSPHQVVLEDDIQRIDEHAAEPPSSDYPGRAEQIAVECCVIASIVMVVGGILINAKRKESLYGKGKRGISQNSRPGDA